jgi:sulfide dehydrogenase [flavocytochrome c] flavoprotein chain
MRRWTRRELGYTTAAATFAAGFGGRTARSQAKPRVVVIGGGAGGATVAKYLAASTENLDVTLVEPNPQYATCFFSNLYLAGLRSFESLAHGYETLTRRYGITVIHDAAATIDPVVKTTTLENGAKLSYDRAVVAPGIAFKYGAIDGYDEAATRTLPHAWVVGPQTTLLRGQLEAMEDGGVFVLVVPADPFRCPPAPYERACLVASYFQRHKPRAKILILDAKDSFFGQHLFQEAWNRHYPGMIEWLPAQFTGGIQAVDAKTRSIVTAGETFKATVANLIPPQVAGQLAQQAGLADRSGWCPVDPVTFESTRQPGIHLVGDAIIAGAMPKTAVSANSQAKACAIAVAASLTGSARFPSHLLSTCYTFLAPNDAISNVSSFTPAEGTMKIAHFFMSTAGESTETRRRTAREAESWYVAFTHDIFS